MTTKKYMGFLSVLVGLCFFFNPYIAGVDVLPDFIGCLLIALGLIPSARVFRGLREAKRRFLTLAALDAVKQMMLAFIFSSSALGEQETLLLTVAFVSATVGTWFAVLAMRSLFDGLAWMLDTYECNELIGATATKRSKTERLARFTVIFIVVKETLLLLPEFAALLNSSYVDSGAVRLYDYIGVMRGLVILPVLILGIVWLCSTIAYFSRLLRQRELLNALREQYIAHLDAHPGVRILARYFLSFVLLALGGFFLVDFYLDFQNIIPDVVGAILLFSGVLLLGVGKKRIAWAATFSALYGAVAAFSGTKAYRFVTSYIGSDITRSEEAAAAYAGMWISALFEMFAFLALLALVLLCLRAVLMAWGGYRPEHPDEAFEERHERRIRDEFDGRLIKCYVFGFISAIVSFLFDYVKTWSDAKELRYFGRLLEALWIPDFLLGILFAAYFAYLLTQVYAKIGERFQFD